MISNGWLVGLEAFAVSLFTAIIQRVWPTPDPNAGRLAYLESRVSELSRLLGVEESPLMIEVKELVTQGRKINAIKLYREQTGVGLREAKDAVDAMEAQMKALDLA